jgi:hypothetical protein
MLIYSQIPSYLLIILNKNYAYPRIIPLKSNFSIFYGYNGICCEVASFFFYENSILIWAANQIY